MPNFKHCGNQQKGRPTERTGPVTMLDVSPTDALEYVKLALENSRLFSISAHARERMDERDINIDQVIKVLEQRQFSEEPTRDVQGRWRCRFDGFTSGEDIGVVVGFSRYELEGVLVTLITVLAL